MKRGWLLPVTVGSSLTAASASTTNTTGTSTTAPSVADQTPTENLATVGARGPSTVIDEARARHLRLRANRLAYQHGAGDASDVSNAEVGSGIGTGTGTGSDDLTGALGDLINSGGLGSLAGLLGGDFDLNSLLGGATGTGGSSNPNIPSNLPPEVLQMLQGAGINIDDVFPADDSSSGTSKTAKRSQGASILQDRWPGKTEAVSQTVEEEESFVDRWKEQMALTFFRNLFTGITAGLSSPQLIENMEDIFRPILRPDSVVDE